MLAICPLVRVILILALVGILMCGCSGSDGPAAPAIGGEGAQTVLTTTPGRESGMRDASHHLWAYFLVYVDAGRNEFEIIPVREAAIHWNVLAWLELDPCTDCFKITKIEPSGSGTLLVDVVITHPLDNPNFTAFDVRGIAMFDASHEFPVSGLTVSDRTLGDGELVNADGYTTLYNWTTEGMGPGGLQGYIKGRFATDEPPDALLNGYKRHISDDPANTRNAFYAGDSVTVTYEIDMPDGEFVFGYAVDANWARPINRLVDDPMTDFPISANCPEPWKIEVTETPIGCGLTPSGGETALTVDVYDWQGRGSHSEPILECLELFQGSLIARWVEDGAGYATYQVTVTNENLAAEGQYVCLIGVEDHKNDQIARPWLDLTAYQMHMLEVAEYSDLPPTAVAKASQSFAYVGDAIDFDGSRSHDNDCEGQEIVQWEWDWEADGLFDDTGRFTSQSYDIEGFYQVQLRVTDDEGGTDVLDTPLEINIEEHGPLDPVDVTPAWLNFSPYGVCADGNYTYVAGAGGSPGLHIFDVSDPSNVVWVNHVSTPSWGADVAVSGGYAYVVQMHHAGLQIIDIDPPESARVVNSVEMPHAGEAVVVSGDYAYVADGDAGLQIVDTDPPESAYVVTSVDTPDHAYGVAVSGGYAYVTSFFAGLQIVDIDPPESAHIVNSVDTEGRAIDVAVSGSYAYATHVYAGFQIIDIDPPEFAHIVSSVETSGTSSGVAVSGSYAYVADGFGGLLVVDIVPPESAHIVSSVDTSGCPRDVAMSGSYAYVADCLAGLQIIDIHSPESAHVVSTFGTINAAFDVGVSGSYACVAGSDRLLKIIDVDPPESAHVAGSVGMLDCVCDVAVSGGYAYATRGETGADIIDIDPPESAHIVSSVGFPGMTLAVAVSNSYACVGEFEYYHPGGSTLHVIDVDRPESARVVSSVDIPGSSYCLAMLGGYAYLGSRDGYLWVFDIDPPESADLVSYAPVAFRIAKGIAVSSGYAYVADSSASLRIVDIDPPESPYVINIVDTPSEARDVAISGGYAHVATGTAGLQIIDIDPPESAYIVSSVVPPYYAGRLAVSGGHAYVADGTGGLRIIKLW